MRINKVVLKNFKTHKDYTFLPSKKGVTSICGANGTGKSSIVDGFSWSLFGTRSRGITNKDYIREGVDPSKEEVSVTSFIEIEGKEYKVVRQILNKKGNTSAWAYLNKDGDYEELSGPLVSHTELFIKRLIGLDEQGFLTSIFIQQKEVDAIINASPSQRGRTIEKLIGIDAITEGISEAKSDSKALQQSADVIQRNNVEEEEKQLTEKNSNIEKLKKEIKKVEKYCSRSEEELKELKEKIEKEQDLIDYAKDLKHTFTQNNETLKSLKTSIKDNYDLYNKLKKNISLVHDINVLTDKEKEQSEKENKINSKIAELNYNISKSETIIKQKTVNVSNEEIIKKDIKDLKEDLIKRNESLAIIRAEGKQKQEYLKLLKEGAAKCPLCGSDVVSSKEHIEESQKELKVLVSKARALKSEKEKFENYIKESEDLLKQIDKDKVLIEEQKKAKKDLIKDKKDLEKAKSIKIKIESQLNVIRKQINDYNEAKKNQELREKLKSTIVRDENLFDKTTLSLNNIKAKMGELKERLDPKFSETKKLYNEKQKEYTNTYAKLSQIKERLESEIEIRDLKAEQLRRSKEAEKKYLSVMKKLNVANQSVSLLSKFKEDRLYKSIPMLTTLASDILNRLTDGNYTKLDMDDKFNCSVETRDGIKRSVRQLSGGEMSSTAISLRLAISFFLSNSNDNLLILDEVLVSMSEERVQGALELISSMKNTQVILIAHNEGANDMADKVVTL